jgi:RNA polymerase sigma-70 factor (ECF subfamily)
MNVQTNANVPVGDSVLEMLYRDYGPRVLRLARRLLGNADDAEDVVQEVFLQAQRKLSTFRGESALSTWLYRMAVNVALAYRRKRGIRDRGRLREEDLENFLARRPPHSAADESTNPQRQALEHERQRLVDEAVACLPEPQRDAVVLADLEQLPLSDVADLLSLSVPAIKSRLHRARAQLRELLAGQLDEGGPRADGSFVAPEGAES